MILVQNVGKSMPIKRIFYIEDLKKSSKMSLAPHVVKFLSQEIGQGPSLPFCTVTKNMTHGSQTQHPVQITVDD